MLQVILSIKNSKNIHLRRFITVAQTEIDLSIIVVAWSIKDVVAECFTAIARSEDHLRKELIYVDNGSTDGTVAMVKDKFPHTLIIESPTNLGFVKANNLAYPQTRGKYILLLNADAFVGKNTLQESVNFMEQRRDCGILGCRLVDRDGVMQPSARYFPTPWNLFLTKLGWINNQKAWLKGIDNLQQDHSQIIECDWVPGCYLMVRKAIIEDLNDCLLRPDFFMYFEDTDICLRVKQKGWQVIFYPNEVIHLGGVNSAKLTEVTAKGKQIEKYNLESEFIYFRKNYGIFTVLWDFTLIAVVTFLRIIKRILSLRNIEKKSTWDRLVLATSILVKTRLGKHRGSE
jgi:GT2 family glycosyltransferase